MSRIPDYLAIRYGELLEAFDDAIKTINESKSNTLDDLRSDLRKVGMIGAEITTEIAMLKGAVKLNRMTQVERQKADDKDDGVADYLNILSLARARAHVRGEEHDADGVIIEPDAAMRPQTGAAETLVDHSEAPELTSSDPLRSVAATREDAGAGASEPIPEPVIVPPPAITEAGDGDSTDSSPGAVPGATNVTLFRTHNPETHFLNSKGLMRLHGCQKPDSCGSEQARLKLCFSCSTQHEGPAFVGGAA